MWKEQIAVCIVGGPALLVAVVLEVRHRKQVRRRKKEEMTK